MWDFYLKFRPNNYFLTTKDPKQGTDFKNGMNWLVTTLSILGSHNKLGEGVGKIYISKNNENKVNELEGHYNIHYLKDFFPQM